MNKQIPLSKKQIVDIQLKVQRKQTLGEISISHFVEYFVREIEKTHGIK